MKMLKLCYKILHITGTEGYDYWTSFDVVVVVVVVASWKFSVTTYAPLVFVSVHSKVECVSLFGL